MNEHGSRIFRKSCRCERVEGPVFVGGGRRGPRTRPNNGVGRMPARGRPKNRPWPTQPTTARSNREVGYRKLVLVPPLSEMGADAQGMPPDARRPPKDWGPLDVPGRIRVDSGRPEYPRPPPPSRLPGPTHVKRRQGRKGGVVGQQPGVPARTAYPSTAANDPRSRETGRRSMDDPMS